MVFIGRIFHDTIATCLKKADQGSYVSICIGYELAYALCSKLGLQALYLSMYICAKFLCLSLDLNIFSAFDGSI